LARWDLVATLRDVEISVSAPQFVGLTKYLFLVIGKSNKIEKLNMAGNSVIDVNLKITDGVCFGSIFYICNLHPMSDRDILDRIRLAVSERDEVWNRLHAKSIVFYRASVHLEGDRDGERLKSGQIK
jgi:hypothetical protein